MRKKIYINNNFYKLNQFLKIKKYINIILLLDDNVKKFCLNILYKYLSNNIKNKIILFEIKSGENNKNLNTCINIWKKLIKLKINKDSLIINFGGGVITDLGGFISSLYKRGINFINIPTTLLSMIDASIGGKNGINFYKLKNEIGIIKNPISIFINYKLLLSLPKKEITSGLGEILKYGLIYNKKLWNRIINKNIDNINWKFIIYKSIKIKLSIVKKDPYELLGYRKILNFGHTIGHAIESLFLYNKYPITHGEAIMLGMICESWISKYKGYLNNNEYKKILNGILKYIEIKKINEIFFKYILNTIENDKKNFNNKIYFVLLKKIGKSIYNIEIKKKIIIDSIKVLNNIKKII
ncbi:MAG: 3-dehydroquinate synthase [Candidatus Shikimatogenerans bostrichidophilus]|nr:MAG: 3-dehydroquinate synthase [Candidatus Shikimatogenerans bostrichidophilus]